MTDPFESSWRKLARAKEHLADLGGKLNEFTRVKPYATVVEAHPDKLHHEVHKIKLTQALPTSIADVAGDVAQNLRSVLDHAGYAVAVASGHTNPKCSAFPFAGSVAQMANALGRSKDIPQQIQSLFCGFQPYRGGDDLLWALNEICNGDKHKMVTPMGVGMIRTEAGVRGTGYFSMPDPHIWNRAKNEMEVITLGPDAEFNYNFNFSLFVAFNEIQFVDGKPVLGILEMLCRKVESILMGIEAEARRIGIVK